MATFSYGFGDSAGCAIVYSSGWIRDISLYRLHTDDDTVAARRSTQSISSLQSQYGTGDDIFRYSQVTKGDYQEQLIRDMCKVNSNTTFKNVPFSTTYAITRFYVDGKIKPQSISSSDQPLYIYTDASVTDTRPPSVGVCILNREREILFLLSHSISPVSTVAYAEAVGFLSAVRIGQRITDGQINIFCDSDRTLSAVEDRETHSDLLGMQIESELKSLSNVESKTILGNDNRVADSLSKEVRHKEVDMMIYQSPAIRGSISEEQIKVILDQSQA